MTCPCCRGPVRYLINGEGEPLVQCAHYFAYGMRRGVCAWMASPPRDLLAAIESAAQMLVDRYSEAVPPKRCRESGDGGHPGGHEAGPWRRDA